MWRFLVLFDVGFRAADAYGGQHFLFADGNAAADFGIKRVNRVFGLPYRFFVAADAYPVAESGNFRSQRLFDDLQVAVLRADQLLNKLIVKKFKFDFCHGCTLILLLYDCSA